MSEQLDQGQAATTESVDGAQPQAQPNPELTVQDLGNLRAIIDVAAQRGAFRAAELEAVGSVFNKLNTFLNAVSPPAQPQEQSESTTEPAAS